MTSTAPVARVERETKESKSSSRSTSTAPVAPNVATGVRFYDHMLAPFGRHALFDLNVHAKGDTDVDAHHTVEDVAIVLGEALRQALRDKSGIRRFGDALVPLDEALCRAVVDVSGRPYAVREGAPVGQEHTLIAGHFMGWLTRHVIETLALIAHLCLQVRVLSGRDPHHVIEAQFKAIARALRDAVAVDPRQAGIPSTKATL